MSLQQRFSRSPGKPKQRGDTFISQVLRQTGKAGHASGGKRGKAPRLAPWSWSYGSAIYRPVADAVFAPRHHQDLAGQPTPCQPAIARQTPALYRT